MLSNEIADDTYKSRKESSSLLSLEDERYQSALLWNEFADWPAINRQKEKDQLVLYH
jgi:hypothetical protein